MEMKLTELEVKDFWQIYELMKVSFIKEEIRTYENGLEQLNKEEYRILISRNSQDVIAGFIAEWNFRSFVFLEHFAVRENMRGTGIGSEILKAYLKKTSKPVVIEVEDNKTEIDRRRIDFYQRRGFFLSEFGYLQPVLRGDANKKIPLRIMSYPEALSAERYRQFKKTVFEKIYKEDDELCE